MAQQTKFVFVTGGVVSSLGKGIVDVSPGRRLTVSGIVRPEDMSAGNTVKHTQIAEARIAYGGRGDISRVQRTPGGQALVERFTPF